MDPTARAALGRALLAIAAERPFRDISLHDIAASAGMPVAAFYPGTPWDAVDCAEELFDRALADGLAAPAPEALARDRLFDVAMRRFEAMEPHRAAILAIDQALERDPAARALQHARHVRAARWILALAGLEADGVVGAARAQGLALILAQTRAAWRRETSGDFARTMATLDGALRRAEETFGRFGGFGARRAGPAASASPDAAE